MASRLTYQRSNSSPSNKSEEVSMASGTPPNKGLSIMMNIAQGIRRMFHDTKPKDSDSSMENAWIQAVYNSVVMLIFGVVISVVVAVYYVLEPFLHPLLWAVLVGMFLFPFKQYVTEHIEQWLNGLEQAKFPLVTGIFISPLSLLKYVSFHIDLYLMASLMTLWSTGIWVLILCIATLYIVVKCNFIVFIQEVLNIANTLFINLDKILSFNEFPQVLLVLLLIIVIETVLCYMPKSSRVVSIPLEGIRIIIWYLALSIVCRTAFGLVGSVVVTALFVVFLIFWLIQSVAAYKGNWGKLQRPIMSIFQTFNRSVLENFFGMDDNDNHQKKRNTDSSKMRTKGNTHKKEGIKEKDSEQSSPGSTWIFHILITTLLAVVVRRYLWLLIVILMMSAIARIDMLIDMLKSFLINLVKELPTYTFDKIITIGMNISFPKPIRMFIQVCKKLDRHLFHTIKSFISPIISGSIIMAMIVGGVAAFIFFLLQVQVELAFSVNMMKDVLNTSVVQSPLVKSIIPGSEGGINSTLFNTHFEEFTDQGYHYGRDWLKHHVELLVNDSTSGSNTAVVVNQILLLYDNFYHIYVFKNDCHVSNISQDYHEMDLFHEMQRMVTGNMESIVSGIHKIMQIVWSVLSVNLSIAVSILSSLLRFIFSGGTMILNLVVFITALFYLLAYSEDKYLPVSIVKDYINKNESLQNTNYTTDFTNMIRSVLKVSCQRACFYGIYTWLVLSVLEMEMTVIPSVLASVTGAIPFIGPYWVSIPAILELWLIRGSPLLAILAVVLFLIPPFLIDTIINSEIQGGHPYLTWLAIAGGMYFTGLEGAVFGPILLCCLLFLVNFLKVISNLN